MVNERLSGMKRMNKRSAWGRGFAVWMLALAVALGGWTSAFAAEQAEGKGNPAGTEQAQIRTAVSALQAQLAKPDPLGDWVALALARGGVPAPNRYAAALESTAKPDSFRLVTDYARVALAVNAHGWDARKVGPTGLDLLGKIANFEKMAAQGPNGPAYSLMALDAGNYKEAPGDLWTRESLIGWLLEHRGEGGGWSLAAGKSDVDLTGIVLTALAPYKEREDVKPAIEEALAWLSAAQNEQGGFGSVGAKESSESAVQVVLALTALDIDPASDARFVKNDRSVLARLMEYRLEDGTFAHVPGGKSDGIASMFALLGLTAVDRWQSGLPGLYSGLASGEEQVVVYGPEGRLAQGTASGRTALDSLVQVLQQNRISYAIERHPQFGPFVTSIGHVDNAQFGGYDGWQYAVRKDGQWQHDLTGMNTYALEGVEQLVVYYGEMPALIHSVELEPKAPREGQPVTVTVQQETFDWESGKAVVVPAVGANVTIGSVTAATDKDGIASLSAVKAGAWTLRVDGYKKGASPDFVTYEQPIEVARYLKDVTVRVEGDQGLIAQGEARGGTALEALEDLLKSKDIAYEVKELSFGKYVSEVDGIVGGKYGGYDGWMYEVAGRNGASWSYPGEGIGTFLLEDGDQVVVYYADNTALPEPIAVAPAIANTTDTITVALTTRPMDWETGMPGAAQPVAGAQVAIAGKTAVTDASGKAQIGELPEGRHQVVVTGYGKDHAPAVLRTVSEVVVAAPYSDQNAIAGWAADWVSEARAAGVLLGDGDSRAAQFQPKRGVTRAEFVAALVRAMGGKLTAVMQPSGAAAAFKDVAADAWYADEVTAAAQAGLVAGVASGQFAPDAQLTREQAAMLLTRALTLDSAGVALLFKDADQVAKGAMPSVQAVLRKGWMTLQDDGTFLPKMTVTREQAAVIAVRLLREFQ